MKKVAMYFIPFLSLLVFNAGATTGDRVLLFDDVNTLNIEEKLNSMKIENVKKLCSYDYCDYLASDDFKNSIDIFTSRYLSSLSDEEVRKSLSVKGIKITKVILDK